MKYRNQFEFKVYGDYALFSDPITRIGGEKCSLHIPTYAALVGVCKSIYFKPTFKIVVDSVKVLNPIRTVSKGIRPISYISDKNNLSSYTYLHNVAYAVRAHFVWNDNHPELIQDRNEDKHFQIMQRMIKIGGRRDVFLGVREAQAYVEPCKFDEEQSCYADIPELSFGLMYHSIIYADEAVNDEDKGKLTVCFHTPIMRKGVVDFIPPENCTIKRHIKDSEIKTFGKNQFSSVDELYKEAESIELDI